MIFEMVEDDGLTTTWLASASVHIGLAMLHFVRTDQLSPTRICKFVKASSCNFEHIWAKCFDRVKNVCVTMSNLFSRRPLLGM